MHGEESKKTTKWVNIGSEEETNTRWECSNEKTSHSAACLVKKTKNGKGGDRGGQKKTVELQKNKRESTSNPQRRTFHSKDGSFGGNMATQLLVAEKKIRIGAKIGGGREYRAQETPHSEEVGGNSEGKGKTSVRNERNEVKLRH